ncbi:MAG: transposase [Chloroflexi bacterium]|nr:MAG: transposase [Chloroflexota bacterium]
MPARKLTFESGNYYHIYNRGAGKRSIFHRPEDYLNFLHRFKKNVAKTGAIAIAYCLMPNHFHFLLRQSGEISVGLAVQWLCLGYAKHFNLKYDEQGALFAGRFQAILVSTDAYLLHLCRYIHANPVIADLALTPELWPYSNYLEWIGKRQGTLVDQEFVQQHFPTPERYISYVYAYLSNSRDLPEPLRDYLATL